MLMYALRCPIIRLMLEGERRVDQFEDTPQGRYQIMLQILAEVPPFYDLEGFENIPEEIIDAFGNGEDNEKGNAALAAYIGVNEDVELSPAGLARHRENSDALLLASGRLRKLI